MNLTRTEYSQPNTRRGALVVVALLIVVSTAFSPHLAGGFQTIQARELHARATLLAQANVDEDDSIPFMKRESEKSKIGSGDGHALGRTLGALLLVLGLLAFGVFLVKRFGPNRSPVQNATVSVAVLKSVPLGERRSLLVVRFAGKNLLLGSTPHGISLLDSDDDLAPKDSAAPSSMAVGELLNFNAPETFGEAGAFQERRRV
jgi:flagellar biosynthetic protein FliO